MPQVPPKEFSEEDLWNSRYLQFVTTSNGLKIPLVHIHKRSFKSTILYSHGNGEDVGLSLHYLEYLSETCKANVVAYEYAGYSIAEGEPSEDNCYRCIDAAMEYLVEKKVHLDTVVVFGRSLGSGPSCDIAARTPGLGGVVLQSPLESGVRVIMGSAASFMLYPLDIFKNYTKIRSIDCPVFIMHGEADEVVPCANGRALYDSLANRPNAEALHYEAMWIPDAGHNNMPQGECMDAVEKFLRSMERRRASH